jgi:hypothetical protein
MIYGAHFRCRTAPYNALLKQYEMIDNELAPVMLECHGCADTPDCVVLGIPHIKSHHQVPIDSFELPDSIPDESIIREALTKLGVPTDVTMGWYLTICYC